jgi:catechol 2,3-dioxygenase-like lactoylglutathione lyase family enzyme
MSSASSAFQTGHVGINVTDLNRSKTFYQRVFGFETMRESREVGKEFAFLGDGQKLFLTLWQQSAGRFETHRPGLHHLSFQVESIADVEAAQQKLQALGAQFFHDGIVLHSEGAQSGGIFFADPDGTRLEIYTPSGVTGEAPTQDSPTCGFF